MHGSELRKEAKRLRLKERLSLKAIAKKLGVAKSTASLWLKDVRLSDNEISERNAGPKPALRKGDALPDESWREQLIAHGLTKHQKAKISESAVLYRLCLAGCSPYGSPFDGDTADWVVELPSGRFARIQVKTTYQGDYGRPTVKLERTSGHSGHRRYEDEDFDFIVGYAIDLDVAYVFTREEVSDYRKAVAVTEESAEAWDKMRA